MQLPTISFVVFGFIRFGLLFGGHRLVAIDPLAELSNTEDQTNPTDGLAIFSDDEKPATEGQQTVHEIGNLVGDREWRSDHLLFGLVAEDPALHAALAHHPTMVEPAEPDDDAPHKAEGDVHAQHCVQVHPEAVKLEELEDRAEDRDLLHLPHEGEGQDEDGSDKEQSESPSNVEIQPQREEREDQQPQPDGSHRPFCNRGRCDPVQEAQDEPYRNEWPRDHEVRECDERERLLAGDSGGHDRTPLKRSFCCAEAVAVEGTTVSFVRERRQKPLSYLFT